MFGDTVRLGNKPNNNVMNMMQKTYRIKCVFVHSVKYHHASIGKSIYRTIIVKGFYHVELSNQWSISLLLLHYMTINCRKYFSDACLSKNFIRFWVNSLLHSRPSILRLPTQTNRFGIDINLGNVWYINNKSVKSLISQRPHPQCLWERIQYLYDLARISKIKKNITIWPPIPIPTMNI